MAVVEQRLKDYGCGSVEVVLLAVVAMKPTAKTAAI